MIHLSGMHNCSYFVSCLSEYVTVYVANFVARICGAVGLMLSIPSDKFLNAFGGGGSPPSMCLDSRALLMSCKSIAKTV